jgi:pyocin large subunit-like protein
LSFEAISWACRQQVGKSSVKFVLVALANHADAQGFAWPSVTSISETTEQDRKTVLAAIATLREAGLIFDTGDKKGGTKQVVVYRLALEVSADNSPKNGTAKQSQKRNSTENGTVPKTTGNSTVFPSKQSQKRDTESSLTINEPSIKHIPAKSSKAESSKTIPENFGISDAVKKWAEGKGFNRLDDHLEHFVGYAKANGKKYTDWDMAFMNAIRGDWAKLKTVSRTTQSATPMTSKNYSEGVSEDGRLH